jgi:hypothetical protein
VNFCQIGLTALIYTEVPEDGSDLAPHETYFLMPCPERMMRPLRMRALRRLTLTEFRMTYLTAVRLSGAFSKVQKVFDSVEACVLGEHNLEN